MKRCTKCGECRSISEFYAAKDTRDGLRGECKGCFAARARTWYAANRERVIVRVKAWQVENPERHAATQHKVREKRKAIDRDLHLKRKFGIGTPEYQALFEHQGGCCAICGRAPRSGSSLHVDHDHETGIVRGLLCFRCNAALGQLDDDPERLTDVIAYLGGGLEPVRERAALKNAAVARAGELVRGRG